MEPVVTGSPGAARQNDPSAGLVPLLRMANINVRFPGVKALDDVDFQVNAGEIHGLMGQNGAGKSTLIKTLTGVCRRERGSVFFEGRAIAPRTPGDAQVMGISTVYQEVNLIPHLSVAENIYLNRQPLQHGQIDWKTMNRRAEEALARLELTLDVTEELAAYSIAIQQMVAIARAVDISARLLILDEPTSSLDEHEVNQLFRVIRKLKSEGLGIIFITHFLDQVFQITDRITVLRNGKRIGEYVTANLTKLDLIRAMVGREMTEIDAALQKKTVSKPNGANEFLKVRQMARKNSMRPFDLDISNGEVVGVAGLLGSGRTELARLIYGIDYPDQGRTLLDGKERIIHSPRQALRCGMGYCPEDRKSEGIIPNLTVAENIILALQAKRGWLKRFSRKKQAEIASNYVVALNIAISDLDQPVKNLSGGNQQKVILARWLASQPRLLILDEPTRGIDISAKAEIERLIHDLCGQGVSLLFISSELEEVVRCSHRVVVLRDRQKIAELNEGFDEPTIIQTIAGGGQSYGKLDKMEG